MSVIEEEDLEPYSVVNDKGKTFYLNRNPGENGYYFFSVYPKYPVAELPAGWEVSNLRGMPVLRKIREID